MDNNMLVPVLVTVVLLLVLGALYTGISIDGRFPFVHIRIRGKRAAPPTTTVQRTIFSRRIHQTAKSGAASDQSTLGSSDNQQEIK